MSKRTRSELMKDLSVALKNDELKRELKEYAALTPYEQQMVDHRPIHPNAKCVAVPVPARYSVRLEYRDDSTNPMKNAKVGDHFYGYHEDDFGTSIDFDMSNVQWGQVRLTERTGRILDGIIHVKIVDYDASEPLEKYQGRMCHSVIVSRDRFRVDELINGPVESDFDDGYIAEFAHGIVYKVGQITFKDEPAADQVQIRELTPDQYAREQAKREDIIIKHDDSEEAHAMTTAVWDAMMEGSLEEQIHSLNRAQSTRLHMANCATHPVEREVHLKWVDFFNALIAAKTLELALETAAEHLGGSHGTS